MLNKFRSRDITNHLTIYFRIIHPWFEYSQRMFRCSSEEVFAISITSKELSCREKVTLNAVMCFVKVYCIHLNVCLLHTMKRMICGEDDNILTSSSRSVSKHVDAIRFSGAEMLRLTTMNVHDMGVSCINQLKKLRAQLFCQENTGSNNNKCFAVLNTHLHHGLSIINHADGFTTTSRHNDLTPVIIPHGIDCLLLMGTKLDHQRLVTHYYIILGGTVLFVQHYLFKFTL